MWVSGVIAEYFDIDPTIVRLLWIILVFCVGTGFLAYIIAATIMPKKKWSYLKGEKSHEKNK